MKKLVLLIIVACCIYNAKAQDTMVARLNSAPIHKWYGMSGAQLIFSKGQVDNTGADIPNILRFNCFFHIQHQFHYECGLY
jgi:hypothetical protein